MSRYHKIQCTSEEANIFKNDVIKFMKENRFNPKKIRVLKCYDGCLKIYSGQTIMRWRLRRGFRFISNNEDGTQTYERHNDPITEQDIHSVFRAEWNSKDYNEDEKYMLLQWLKKHFSLSKQV